MRNSGIPLDQLPPRLRAQVIAQLGAPEQVAAALQPPPKRRGQPESEMQQAVIRWWALAFRSFGLDFEGALYAVPNGGVRNKATAGRLKAEGVRAGYPDLGLDVPVGKWHGMRVELKVPPNVLSGAQRDYAKRLVLAGYHVRTCYSFAETVEAIGAYLRGEIV